MRGGVSLPSGVATVVSNDGYYAKGIPPVPSSMDWLRAIPSTPGSWTTNTAGFYYVKQGGSNVGNGYPGSPRGTLPASVAAGDVVVLDSTTTLSLSGSMTMTFSGSSGSRCWFISSRKAGIAGSTAATIDFNFESFDLTGSWAFVDDIDFYGHSSTGGTGLVSTKNFVCRNTTFRGSTADRTGNYGSSIQGLSSSDWAQMCVFYNCTWRDHGNWQYNATINDYDCHGLKFGQYVRDCWFLDCFAYHNQGDGMQMGDSNVNHDVFQRIWMSRLTAYENIQTGFWVKAGLHIVVSEALAYGHIVDNSGEGQAQIGGQYGLDQYWVMFSRLRDGYAGIRFASQGGTGTGGSRRLRTLGNVITNMQETAIAVYGGIGSDVAHAFNTCHGYVDGIDHTPDDPQIVKIDCNILSGRSGAAYDIIMEGGRNTQPKIRYNLVPASPRLDGSEGSTSTSVATFNAVSPTNRQGNVSGSPTYVSQVSSGLGNFALQAGSAGIDAASLLTDYFDEYSAMIDSLTDADGNAYSAIDIRKDFAGVARPVNSLYDIGAYEQ